MKKYFILLVTFSFFVSILGVNVSLDYCPMKESYSFSFIKKAYTCCCTKSTKRNCCKSEKVIFKKITDHYVASVIKFLPLEGNIVLQDHYFIIFESINSKPYTLKGNYKPPVSQVPLNILYRSILV